MPPVVRVPRVLIVQGYGEVCECVDVIEDVRGGEGKVCAVGAGDFGPFERGGDSGSGSTSPAAHVDEAA